MPSQKYRSRSVVDLRDRRWPDRVATRAPVWCSVDLRDGNQALIDPMDLPRKQRLFDLLVDMGFKEIEVAFPSASGLELDFVRSLIEERPIPDDVTIQVLTQAREELVGATLEAVRGARRVIVHVYNSTSELQRRVVFGKDRAGVIEIAAKAVRQVAELAASMPETEVILEYSPESFTDTELDFAVEICEAVMDEWQPTPERKMILNLPATVEVSGPNVYADQVEWFGRNISRRDHFVLSVHPHNDRGTAVAAAELALLAGADRVEGTLLGNGERTGNVDVVTLACNLFSQGIDPGLDCRDVSRIVREFEHCNRLPVNPRHPYVGDLVFTAFSGSHQDAIKKGIEARSAGGGASAPGSWEVPYLPVDPADLGRSYEAVIRINSQSGKGGIAWMLERNHGLQLPRRLQIEFRQAVQRVADARAEELDADDIWKIFRTEYLDARRPFELVRHQVLREAPAIAGHEGGAAPVVARAVVRCDGVTRMIEGRGNGPIDAFAAALTSAFGVDVRVTDYREHAIGRGAAADAAAYVELIASDGRAVFGVGLHPDIATACFQAVVCALNRSLSADEATRVVAG